MDPYTPRPILIDSNTMVNNHFLCGFVSFPTGIASTVGDALYIPGIENELPYLLYPEIKADRWLPARPLQPFTFSELLPIPKEFDVQFEYGGKKSPKIKVTATMGHPDDDQPELYKPRVFVLLDTQSELVGSGSKSYGFLVDICQGDTIRYTVGDGEIFVVIIDTSNNMPGEISTTIFLFPVDITVPAFTLDLVGKEKGSQEILFSDAPVFEPGAALVSNLL